MARCRVELSSSRRVVVASRKGGVGKTTTALMLGHTLAALRLDRVVVVDGDPDGGTLAHRVSRGVGLHIGDLLHQMRDVHGYTSIRRFTVQTPSGLEVLATPANPDAGRSYHSAEYLRVLAKLGGNYGLILLDTGTGVLDNVTAGILEAADQLVLVTGVGADEARATASTLDWLQQQGSQRLVTDAVVVISQVWPTPVGDVEAIRAHFAARCRAVHVVGHDPHLALGAVVDPPLLAPSTRRAWLEVAASVADGFMLDSARRSSRAPGPT